MEEAMEFNDNLLTMALTNELGWIHSRNVEMDDNLPDYVLDRMDDPRVLIFSVPNAYLAKKDIELTKRFLANYSLHHPGGRDFEIILLWGQFLFPHDELPCGITIVNVTDSDKEIGFKELMLN